MIADKRGMVKEDGCWYNVRVMEDPAFIRSLSETHRWLLFLLPIVLLATSAIIQWVYGARIGDKHASDYRRAVGFCVGMSLLAIVVFGIESF